MSQIIIVLSDNDAGGCTVDVEYCPPLALPLSPAQQVAARVMETLRNDFGAHEREDADG